MCIICTKDYTINATKLDCRDCKNIKEIPKKLVKLKDLNCNRCENIKEIPKELVNLKKLSCSNTQVKEISKELVNLKYLDCEHTQVKNIPKELVKIETIYHNDNCIQDKSWYKTSNETKKIIKLQRCIKLYLKLPTLWRIAEYYTQKKYSPENIMKYIDLEG